MDPVIELTDVVQHEVAEYANVNSWKATKYYTQDDKRRIYSVIVVPDFPRSFPARVVVMARIVDDKVIIDEDTTDNPLYEELIRNGIPREQIILAYAGETMPEPNEEKP